MKGNKLVFPIVLISILIIIFINFKQHSEKKILEANFSRMMELNSEKKMALIDFSMIGTFMWERLYIFEPYSSCKQIQKATKAFWFGCEFLTQIPFSDNIVLFVFTKDNNIIQYFEYPRGPICDFAKTSNREHIKGYAREEAVFVIQENECIYLNQ